ncbi:MAG: T9SS type A sorting domain-containing protein [Cyclonatronaceae bacterium]
MNQSYKTCLYGMVVSVLIMILTMPYTLILAQSINSSSSAALVVLNTSSLTTPEAAARTMFENYGMTVTTVNFSTANYDLLKDYDLTLAVEDQALNSETINQLLENGKKVLLLFSAAKALGGDWRSSTSVSYRQLAIEQNQAFFEGYRSPIAFEVQKGGTAHSIISDYPGGWTALGWNAAANYKSVFYREHGSGSRGVIFTYNPAEAGETGKNIYDMIFEYLMDTPAYTGKTVTAGHVAFVITRYNDDDLSPDLTSVETWLQTKLLAYGYDITYIRFSRLRQSDLSGAKMVVATEYPSIDMQSISDHLSAGRDLALYYNSAASLGGDWRSSTGENWRRLSIEQNQAFFSGYSASLNILVQKDGTAYSVISDYPGGWTAIGSNTNAGYKTVLFQVHASGGKGLIFAYNPAEISETGKNMDDLIYQWFEDEPASAGKTVPAGSVAFVISRYNDDDLTPDLSSEETWLQTKLSAYGYSLSYIRFSRLRQSDLSGAVMVVAAEYPSIDLQSASDLLSAGKNLALYYTSAASLGGDWRSSSVESWRSLSIEQNQAFLAGYSSGISFVVQKSGTAYNVLSDYPGGWTAIASGTSTTYKSVFYRVHTSGAKGLIYTYSPGETSETGKNIDDMIYEWFEGSPAYAGKTIGEDKVAFVITRYTDDDLSPDLTAVETALQTSMLANGYELSYIRFSRLRHSDLSEAKMVVAAEYPSIDMVTINEQLADGMDMALYYNSAASLGGDWRFSTGENYRSLTIEQSQAFLAGYQSVVPFVVQKSGTAYSISADYPGGWTAIGLNAGSNFKSVFYRVHASGGKGLIYTYNPAEISETGKNIDDLIYEWFEGTPAHEGKTVEAGNVAFVISRYNDSDQTPDLTSEETALHFRLTGYGYNITFIRSSRLRQSDLAGARMIVAATFPAISANDITDYITNGKKVLLFNTSGSSLGGVWRVSAGEGYRSMIVEQNQAFLDGYKSELAFVAQKAGGAYAISSDYPGGWTAIARNTSSTYKTILYRTHASGGKGLIYTYNPAETSESGKNIEDMINEWMEESPPAPGKTVNEDNIAFVITRFNDDDLAPDLNTQETALQARLLDYGFSITYVRFSRLRHSDLSAAKIVVAAAYPSLDMHSITSKLTEGSNIALFYASASVLGGRWNESTTASYRSLYVESSADYMSEHHIGYQAEFQSAEKAYAITNEFPAGWTILGRNTNTNYKTAFSFTGAGRGAILTYSTSHTTSAADTVIYGMFRWLQGMPVNTVREITELPEHFMLHQNYPNPFNPATTIRYDLPEPGHVQIRIYNLTGQLVAMPVNGTIPAGYHTLQLNATKMASGMYLYEMVAQPADMQSKTYVKTRKMMLIK